MTLTVIYVLLHLSKRSNTNKGAIMEYEQALKATITFTDAKQEIKKHGYCFNEFLQDVGERVKQDRSMFFVIFNNR